MLDICRCDSKASSRKSHRQNPLVAGCKQIKLLTHLQAHAHVSQSFTQPKDEITVQTSMYIVILSINVKASKREKQKSEESGVSSRL